MTDDWTLLHAYARERDQEAFAKLVAKYADFTFHTALRRTRNHQLAEDVTQAVFIALARSASSLRRNGSLGAWLHKTALFASTTALRSESRRRKRELVIANDRPMNAATDDTTDTDRSTAAIEEELHRLAKSDRDLLSLHYLEGRTMSQTADALGVSLDAARKRQTRALHRLRTRLKARGVTISSVALSGAICAIGTLALQSAPAQIASTVIAGGKSGAAFSLVSRIVQSMRLATLSRTVAAVLVLCLVPSVVGMAIMRQARAEPAVSDVSRTPVRIAMNLPQPPATSPTTLPAPSIELPDRIRRALVRNAEQIGPITLAWTMQASSKYTKERAMNELNIDEYTASFNAGGNRESRLSWQEGKYRSHTHTPMNWPGIPPSIAGDHNIEGAFDGDTIYMGEVRPRPDNPDIRPQGSVLFRIPLAHVPTQEFNMDNPGWADTEFLDSIGLRMPVTIGDLKVGRGPQSHILFLLEQGARLIGLDDVELEGQKLVRLQLTTEDPDRASAMKADIDGMADRLRQISVETDERIAAIVEAARNRRQLPEHRTYVFYLDPELNFAIRQSEQRYSNGTTKVLLGQTICQAFQRLDGRDLYLPAVCVSSSFVSPMLPGKYFSDPVSTMTYRVTDLLLKSTTDDRFSISYTAPGCEIIDILDDDGGRLKGPAEGYSPRRHVVIQEDGSVVDRFR